MEVVWLDAQSSLDVMTIKEMNKKFKPHLTKSVGYLMEDNKEYVVLAFTDFGGGNFKHWQLIPTGTIKDRKVIKK